MREIGGDGTGIVPDIQEINHQAAVDGQVVKQVGIGRVPLRFGVPAQRGKFADAGEGDRVVEIPASVPAGIRYFLLPYFTGGRFSSRTLRPPRDNIISGKGYTDKKKAAVRAAFKATAF
jgi:hypothetical protein